MSFETKHERKQKRRNKLTKAFREKKFRLYGDVSQKNESHKNKRKDKYDFGYDDMDLSY